MENNIVNSINSRITVKNLRQSGFKVRVGHYRFDNFLWELTLDSKLTEFQKEFGIRPKGGKTTIELTKDGIDATGEAICCMEDNYNRKLGVKIALGRALAAWQAKKAFPCMPDKNIGLINPIEIGPGS